MQVLYVDIYFLINFTVDLIALFLAVKLLHIKTTLPRLLTLSSLGAIYCVAEVLWLDAVLYKSFFAVLFLLICAILVSRDASALRRIKFIIVFIFVEMLLGGIVSFMYGILDKYSELFGELFSGSAENRQALLFSLIILLAIGVLKLFITVLSGAKDIKTVRLSLVVGDKSVSCDALVDSGNLVKDPMNMNPVVFVKTTLAKKLLPREILDLTELETLAPELRKRIRLIPVTRSGETHVMTGVVPESAILSDSGEISVTVAIDKEEGTFGGYEALVPFCVIE